MTMKNCILLLFCTGLSIICFSQNIVQGEYFVDTDLGYGNNTLVNVIASPDSNFSFNINLSGFNVGYHHLYFRTKDSDGKWSTTARRNIEVFASQAKTSIVKGEYFIDTDPGFGMATPITITTSDSAILQNFSVIATNLSEGFHKLYGRFEDNLGKWSLTFRRSVEIYKSDANNILNGEYFFKTDQGFGSCAPVAFAVPNADGSFVINIPRNTIPVGADTLFVRVRDDIENRWSITQIVNNINAILPLTLLDLTAIKQNSLVQLSWRTANEMNTSYFNIQRSVDGTSFTTVGRVIAAGAGLQNNYSYPDDIAYIKDGPIYYRLQMVDNDGKFTYSKIIYISITNDLKVSIYPNPAHEYFTIINHGNQNTSNTNFLIRDMSGRTLINGNLNNSPEQKINITNLSKGVYIISIIGSENIHTQKLVVE